jgi:hypothetical protein
VPSHFGGTRNGMVISWPSHIHDLGGIRTQFHHVIDIAPTILAAAGLKEPIEVNGTKRVPMAGISMEYTFDDPKAPGRRHTQYFQTGGHRAICHDGWVAASFHGVPWELTGSIGFKNNKWELYNIDEDFSEAHDLAARYPDKLAALKKLFDEEAAKYDVYPLDDRFAERVVNPERPSFIGGRSTFEYTPGAVRIPEGNAPPIYQRSHRITATAEIPEGGASGVIVAEGGSSGGYTLYLDDGVPVYDYNYFGEDRYRIGGTEALAPGQHTVVLDYRSSLSRACR